ncbi:MAG: hypothetical protein AAB460_02740 [Patescibacteria group bacterium]
MAQEFQTSFIPKKTFEGTPVHTKVGIGGILSIIAASLFVLSLLISGGVFLYERFLETSLTRKKETLEQAKKAFEPELIRELSRLDARLSLAGDLLDAHVAPSGMFDLLEDLTLETVRFTSFGYGIEEGGVRVTLQGEARSFASVALQSDEFAKNRSVRDPIFSGLTLDERGDVEFTVSALVDPKVLSYKDRALSAGTAWFDITPEEDGVVAGASVEAPNM